MVEKKHLLKKGLDPSNPFASIDLLSEEVDFLYPRMMMMMMMMMVIRQMTMMMTHGLKKMKNP